MDEKEKATYLIRVLCSKTSALRVCDKLIENNEILDKDYYKRVKEEINKQ